MKKAKILVAIIAFSGIVGGTLAFKANRSNQTVYTTNALGAVATAPLTNAYGTTAVAVPIKTYTLISGATAGLTFRITTSAE